MFLFSAKKLQPEIFTLIYVYRVQAISRRSFGVMLQSTFSCQFFLVERRTRAALFLCVSAIKVCSSVGRTIWTTQNLSGLNFDFYNISLSLQPTEISVNESCKIVLVKLLFLGWEREAAYQRHAESSALHILRLGPQANYEWNLPLNA